MNYVRRAGLIPERIWPLAVGTWSFQTGLQAETPGSAPSAVDASSACAPNLLSLRLFLIGLAIILEGYNEIPFVWIQKLIGLPVAAILALLCLALNLACLCLAVSPRLPQWFVGKPGLIIGRVTVVACLILGVVSLGTAGLVSFEVSQTPGYYNDGTLLDHNAALLLLHGQDPYTQSDIVAATRAFHQAAQYTTPLQQGKLAHQQTYPSDQQLQQLLAQEPLGHPDQVPEFESHVSYPALAFLSLVPLVWAGLPKVSFFYILCLALLVIIGLRSVRYNLRWWVALLVLADIPVIVSTLDGTLDIFYILLIFLAWLWYRHGWLSAALLGLALASKQIAWFYLPFYLIFIWQRYGWKAALWRLVCASILFAIINLPFIIWDAGGWVAGVLAPMRDPMFPEGDGLIVLSIGTLLPFLPRASYSALEALGLVSALIWYWRWGRARPEAAMVLAVLPLCLAWRSLPSYFEFCALPTAFLLAQPSGFAAAVRDMGMGKSPTRLYNITRQKEAIFSRRTFLFIWNARVEQGLIFWNMSKAAISSGKALDGIFPIPRFRRVKKASYATNANVYWKIRTARPIGAWWHGQRLQSVPPAASAICCHQSPAGNRPGRPRLYRPIPAGSHGRGATAPRPYRSGLRL